MSSSQPKIYIAGHLGMVGSALVRQLQSQGHSNFVVRTHAQLDLIDQRAVVEFFAMERPDHVYMAAARVGGIHANNTYPAEFIYENLMVQCNVIQAAHLHGVQKLLFLGSSCIYPREAPQPMGEGALLLGKLEPTNEPYAIAKIAGIKTCESYNRQYGRDYRSVMPTNLYGPGDNYHPENSHVVPGLIRRFHQAKTSADPTVIVWGTGSPMREFLYVDDMAAASIHVMQLDKAAYDECTTPTQSHINVGYGSEVSIANLAHTVASVVGYQGDVVFDTSKPDGMPRKLLDSGRLQSLGWQSRVTLVDGPEWAYADFLAQQSTGKLA